MTVENSTQVENNLEEEDQEIATFRLMRNNESGHYSVETLSGPGGKRMPFFFARADYEACYTPGDALRIYGDEFDRDCAGYFFDTPSNYALAEGIRVMIQKTSKDQKENLELLEKTLRLLESK